jgi:hypothetical protein
MNQCIIVSGDDALATTIVEELKRTGMSARGPRAESQLSAEYLIRGPAYPTSVPVWVCRFRQRHGSDVSTH